MWHVVSTQVTVSYSLCTTGQSVRVIPSEHFDENQPDWLFLRRHLAYHLFHRRPIRLLDTACAKDQLELDGWLILYVARSWLSYSPGQVHCLDIQQEMYSFVTFVLGCLFLQIKWQWTHHVARSDHRPRQRATVGSVIYSFTPGQVVNALSCATYNHKATSIVLDTTCTCPSNS